MELRYSAQKAIFVLYDCTYADRHIPKAARFRWNPELKKWWTDDVEKASALKDFANEAALEIINGGLAEIEEALEESRATDADIEIPAPEGLDYLPYQRGGIAYASARTSSLIGDEMGLGKTIQALGVINLDASVKSVLVICPASLKLNWAREAEKWLVREFSIGVADGKIFPETDIVVINYDVLKKHHKTIRRRTWDLLVVDECHYLKNTKAQRTKEVLGYTDKKKPERNVKRIEAGRRIFLTGTPIVNRPIELWGIANSLDPETFKSFWTYAKRYCNAEHNGYGYDFTGAANLDELQIKLRTSIMVRRLKADVLKELPPKVRQVIEVPANGHSRAVKAEQKRAGEILARLNKLQTAVELAKTQEEYDQAVAELSMTKSALFTEMAKLRHETALLKVDAVIEHLETAIDGGKVVCMAHHRDVINEIMEAFPGIAVKVTGDTPMDARQAAVDRFQNDDDCRLFVGNIQAAGVGLTLTASNHVVFAELDWVPGNMSQAEDRCHRIGQVNSVLVQHLVLDGSLDAKLAKTLVAKQEIIDKGLDTDVEAGLTLDMDALQLMVEADQKKAKKKAKAQKQDQEALGITDEEIAHIHHQLRYLAGRCDGASSRDDAGFNGVDAHFGHRLAAQETLTPRQAVAARDMLHKYSKTQLAWAQ